MQRPPNTTDGTFEVAIVHDQHGELGTLDRTFDTDFDADMAAHDASINAVGISAEVRQIDPDTSNTMPNEPHAPSDPRKCNHCHNLYGLLVKACPVCGSEDTQFVDETTHEPTDGYGTLLETTA